MINTAPDQNDSKRSKQSNGSNQNGYILALAGQSVGVIQSAVRGWVSLSFTVIHSFIHSFIHLFIHSFLYSCNKGMRQGDGLSPVLFSLFMNDLPQYFKQNNCPGVV